MKFERHFTAGKEDIYSDIEFQYATSEIRNMDGRVVFKAENVETPLVFVGFGGAQGQRATGGLQPSSSFSYSTGAAGYGNCLLGFGGLRSRGREALSAKGPTRSNGLR